MNLLFHLPFIANTASDQGLHGSDGYCGVRTEWDAFDPGKLSVELNTVRFLNGNL